MKLLLHKYKKKTRENIKIEINIKTLDNLLEKLTPIT